MRNRVRAQETKSVQEVWKALGGGSRVASMASATASAGAAMAHGRATGALPMPGKCRQAWALLGNKAQQQSSGWASGAAGSRRMGIVGKLVADTPMRIVTVAARMGVARMAVATGRRRRRIH